MSLPSRARSREALPWSCSAWRARALGSTLGVWTIRAMRSLEVGADRRLGARMFAVGRLELLDLVEDRPLELDRLALLPRAVLEVAARGVE
eukprot:5480441-Alexandrium_andersonii.AAC.1